MFIICLLFLLSSDLRFATSTLTVPDTTFSSNTTHPNTHSITTTTTHTVFSNFSLITTTTTITTVTTVTTVPIPHNIPSQISSPISHYPVAKSSISFPNTLNPIETSEPTSIDIPISENLVEASPTLIVTTEKDIETIPITTTSSPVAVTMPSLENLLIHPTSSYTSSISTSASTTTPSSLSSIISPHATTTSASFPIISTTNVPNFDVTPESDLLSTTPSSPSDDSSATFSSTSPSIPSTTIVPDYILTPETFSIDPTPQSDLLSITPSSSPSDEFLASSFSSTTSSITSTTDASEFNPTPSSDLLSTPSSSIPSDDSFSSTRNPIDATSDDSNSTTIDPLTSASPSNVTTSASTLPANSTEAPTTTTKAPRPKGCETVDPSWSGAFERCEDVSNHVLFFNDILENNLFGSAPTLEVDFDNILSMCAAYKRCPTTNRRQCFLPFLYHQVKRICLAANLLKSDYGVCLRTMLKPLPQIDTTAEAKEMCQKLTLDREAYHEEIFKTCGDNALNTLHRNRDKLTTIYQCNRWPEFV